MKFTQRLAFAVALALLLGAVSCNGPSAPSSDQQRTRNGNKGHTQFEYFVIFLEQGQEVGKLNQLGRQGWELVAVDPMEEGARAHPFYFKRKLESAEQDAPSDGDNPEN